MQIFDERYVRTVWNDNLYSKLCFVGNEITDLIANINCNRNKTYILPSCKGTITAKPFSIINENNKEYFRFAYFDKLYPVKYAFSKGKKILVKVNTDSPWEYCLNPTWHEHYLYKVDEKDLICTECTGCCDRGYEFYPVIPNDCKNFKAKSDIEESKISSIIDKDITAYYFQDEHGNVMHNNSLIAFKVKGSGNKFVGTVKWNNERKGFVINYIDHDFQQYTFTFDQIEELYVIN